MTPMRELEGVKKYNKIHQYERKSIIQNLTSQTAGFNYQRGCLTQCENQVKSGKINGFWIINEQNQIYSHSNVFLAIHTCESLRAFVAALVLNTQLLNYIAQAIMPTHDGKSCLKHWMNSHHYCMQGSGLLLYRKRDFIFINT